MDRKYLKTLGAKLPSGCLAEGPHIQPKNRNRRLLLNESISFDPSPPNLSLGYCQHRPALGNKITGQQLQPKQPTPRREKKIFFKSLKKTTTKETVEKALSKYGKLKFVRLPFSKQKQRNLGYGYAIFECEAEADFVLGSLHELIIDGKPVKLQAFIEHNQKSNHEIKQVEDIVSQHLREVSSDFFTIESKFVQKPEAESRIESQSDPKANNVYYARWSIHSVKPCHSLYFKLAKKHAQGEGPFNFQLRVRTPEQRSGPEA